MNLKRFLGVALMLVLPCSAIAGEGALQVAVFGSNAVDFSVMRAARDRGLREWNPALGQSLGQELGVKGAITAAEMLLVHHLYSHGQRRAAIVGGIGIVAINLVASGIGVRRLRRVNGH